MKSYKLRDELFTSETIGTEPGQIDNISPRNQKNLVRSK